ncbi:MAG: response regulator transcription factor [Ardenticatenaceae bacterium]|nr:response regulator transcription factor [Ardenticatenaceae bacterium]MCB9443020.1 response regulator transcription factor [Ardenticatenaceae bacterium]
MGNSKDILVVDDEASVVEVVSLYLKRDGYGVRVARNGQAALQAIAAELPALVILDLMLPEVDGLEILRRLRADPETDVPVIMLTARGQEIDRIYGLELGADDYVTKPFSPAELVSRVKAVLRRSRRYDEEEEGERPLQFPNLRIEAKTRTVLVRGQPIDLTATEFDLLWFMASHPRQVFKRDQLLEKVWGFSEYVDPSTVTVHIRRLREKIETNPSEPVHLLTVWGVGYKFEPGEG